MSVLLTAQQKYRKSEKYRQTRKAWYEKNKEEVKKRAKDWAVKNKDRVKQSQAKNYSTEKYRKYSFKSRYGISTDEYNTFFQKQDGKCKICNITSEKRLYVDHCHTTGKIRGLLCQQCNTGLGMFKDNEDNLMKAIKYLKGEV